MKAEVQRNKETGEFSCVVGENVLLKGKIASGIKRVHDMADAINSGYGPKLTWDGTAENRRFVVQVGDFVVFSGDGAIKAYRELDKLEAALLDGPVMIENPEDAGSASPAQEMPESGDIERYEGGLRVDPAQEPLPEGQQF